MGNPFALIIQIPMKYNLSELRDIIRNRRSIQPENFKPRKVLKDVITELLTNATWAPTHGQTEPWHFVVFQDNAIKELAEFLANTYKNQTPQESFLEQKYQKLQKRPLSSSVAIAVCMKRQPSEKINKIEEIEAVACAVQNMHLTATAYGLGGFWSTPQICYTSEMNTFLNLSEKDMCLGIFYVGYPNIEWPKSHRQPLEYHAEWRN